MKMYSSRARFDTRKYLVITNLFFNAPSDLSVTREDLLSILEQFEDLERYRFQEQSERSHWTKAYVQFKDCYHTEQAFAILQSMKYIKVELLLKIFNRYIEFEENLRHTNPKYSTNSCVIVEVTYSNFLYKDLFDKFSSYGSILYSSDHGSFTVFWYKTICEALAAEIDNNKWNKDSCYFEVKLLEQTKELTVRMMHSNGDRDYNLDNWNFSKNACNKDALTNDAKMPVFNEINDNKIDKSKNNVEVNDNSPIEPRNEVDELSPTELQDVAFNPNDYTFYLQIIRKCPPTQDFDANTEFSSGISIELSQEELYGRTNIFSDNLSTEIQDSLPTKFQSLNIEEPEYDYSKNISPGPYDSCNIEQNATDTYDEYSLNGTNYKREQIKSENKILQENGSCETSNSLPFYRCGVIDNYAYTDCFYPYFEYAPEIYNNYNCSCNRSWTSNLSPWSIVPNVFIVPTTSFGRCRRNVVSKKREPREKEIIISPPAKVPDFNETNFPPLGTNECLSSKTLQMTPKKSASDSEKSHKIKKKKNRKKPKQMKPLSNVKDASFIDVENSMKVRVRRKRTPLKSISDKQNIFKSEAAGIKFKSYNVSCQTLSSTPSEDKNECIKLKCNTKPILQKYKATAIPIFSCSSNSTLNFHSSNKRWRHFKSEKY